MFGEKINIPFLPEWKNNMLTGKKTATTRNKRYGYPNDYFEIFGRQFILLSVYRIKLGSVAHDHYLEEGCNSSFEFIKVWDRLHPRKHYQSEQKVCYHVFKLQVDMCPFHVHELTNMGECRICGCVPRSVMDEVEVS